MIRLNWHLARKTFMTNKQQIEHPSFTKGEILRMDYTISRMLEHFNIRERELFDENICLYFWEVNPQQFAVGRGITRIFKSKNTEKIKNLVCAIYDVFCVEGRIVNAGIYSDYINRALRNSPHYYFGNGKFVLKRPAEIQETINRVETSRYEKVRSYIKDAASLLYNHDNPNYGGSMMASITALELVVREITGENDIQKGIGSLENKGIKLHSQFQQAIMNLYRFTSADGVRHAHPNPVQSDEETALFMLVVCSAIINFIEARLPEQDSE